MLRLVNLGIVGGAAIALAAYLAAPSPAGAQTVPDTTPEGMVAFFPLTECPAGWSISASARGRFLMAVTEGSDVGGTVGTALTAGELPTSHTHTFQTSVSLSSHGCYDSRAGASVIEAPMARHRRACVKSGRDALCYCTGNAYSDPSIVATMTRSPFERITSL